MAPSSPQKRWFARREGGLGVGPAAWQGRATIGGWALLVLVALITYPTIVLTIFVVLFYTAVLVAVVVLKSDLLDGEHPSEG